MIITINTTVNSSDELDFAHYVPDPTTLGLSAKSSRFCEGRVCEMHIAVAQ